MAEDLDSRLLRAFVTAAREGSMSRAARVLGQTQPALSQQLRRLESIVERSLLHRSRSGVTLTRAGEGLLPYAERILALQVEAVQQAGRALAGHCTVALLEDLAASQLRQLLADLSSSHDEVRLEVLTLSASATRQAYQEGLLDLVLDEARLLPAQPTWTVSRPLVWAAGHGVDLSADPLPVVLFSSECTWRTAVLDALEAANRPWRIAFESNSLFGVLAGLRAGAGITALLPANVDPSLTLRHDLDLPALPNIELGLVRYPRTTGDPLVDAVEGALRRTV